MSDQPKWTEERVRSFCNTPLWPLHLADAITAEIAAEREKMQELEAWKESALSVMPDFQAIGKELGLTLGESVHDKILPAIQQLRAQLAEIEGKFKNFKRHHEQAETNSEMLRDRLREQLAAAQARPSFADQEHLDVYVRVQIAEATKPWLGQQKQLLRFYRERERANHLDGLVIKLQSQLAAARAAIVDHNAHHKMPELKIKLGDTTALDAAIAEARQPLVDALTKIALQPTSCSCCLIAQAALAKLGKQ